MNEIKTFLKSVVLFVPFSMTIYILLVIIGGNIPFQFIKPNINYRIGSYGHMYSRIKDIKNYKNVDILFLGSSHSYRGFDIRLFEKQGLKCFNLGSSSQTPIQTEVLLKRYLDSLSPKLIIFEVSPMIFSSDGVESSLDLIANDENDILTITKLIKFNNIKTINTVIFGFYRDWLHINDNFIEKRKKGNDYYISGGFVEKKMDFYKPIKIKPSTIKLNHYQIKAFDRCIKIINSKNIELTFVQAPITKNLYSSYTNLEGFDKLIMQYSKYGKYYNFNNGYINLEDSIDFFDSHHLNQNGVRKFNLKLIDLLKREKHDHTTKN